MKPRNTPKMIKTNNSIFPHQFLFFNMQWPAPLAPYNATNPSITSFAPEANRLVVATNKKNQALSPLYKIVTAIATNNITNMKTKMLYCR